jgi:hypothetical protein
MIEKQIPITLDELKTIGKPTALGVGDIKLLTNVVCRDFNSDTCDTCKLRFKCATNEMLMISLDEMSSAAILPVLQTIESAIEHFLILNKGGSITMSIKTPKKIKQGK